jgi:hypothetical protein
LDIPDMQQNITFQKYVENFGIFVIPLLGNGINSVTKGISSFEICYFLDYDGITMAKHGALCK